MANSIPHLLTDADLAAAIDNFAAVLRTRGRLVIQLLNYHKILAEKERIVSIDRKGEKAFIRFYDFLADGMLQFNVLRVHWKSENSPVHRLQSTRLRPYTCDELENALTARAFGDIRFYSSPQFDAFDVSSSDTLLITARSP